MLTLALFIILVAVALPSVYATPTLVTRATSITFVISSLLIINIVNYEGIGVGLSLYNGIQNINITTLSSSILLLVIGGIALIPWSREGNNGETSTINNTFTATISTYPLFALISIIGSIFLISSGDLITLYLALELQSFSLYIIASLYRDNESATHSGLLYFLLGGLSSCFILLGSALIYNEYGIISIDSIISLIQTETYNVIPWTVYFAWATIATGFLFKVTAAPYHNWGPDVYDGVPTIITTWISVLPKISLLTLLIIITIGIDSNIINININNNIYPLWSTILIISSFLSLIIGTVVGLAQNRVKRLLAYSTISHVGFILLALSIHSEAGIESFLFYLLQYTITSITSFIIVLSIGYNRYFNNYNNNNNNNNNNNPTDIGFINEITEIFATQPIIGISFAICLFSIAGVPPLIGFFGKQFVLSASIDAGYTFISFLAIIVSVISASYYLYLVRVIHFDKINNNNNNVINNDNNNIINNNIINNEENNNNVNNNVNNNDNIGTTNVHSYIISLFTISIILFIINPGIVLDSVSLMAMSLYNTL